jgi:integrase
MKGVDLLTVSQLVGHTTTRMTERYSHLSPAHKRAAVELLPKGLLCYPSVTLEKDGAKEKADLPS